MPKIVAPSSGAGSSVAELMAPSRSSARGNASAERTGAGAFDEMLTTARRREPAKTEEPRERAEPAAETEAGKPSKTSKKERPNAARDARKSSRKDEVGREEADVSAEEATSSDRVDGKKPTDEAPESTEAVDEAEPVDTDDQETAVDDDADVAVAEVVTLTPVDGAVVVPVPVQVEGEVVAEEPVEEVVDEDGSPFAEAEGDGTEEMTPEMMAAFAEGTSPQTSDGMQTAGSTTEGETATATSMPTAKVVSATGTTTTTETGAVTQPASAPEAEAKEAARAVDAEEGAEVIEGFEPEAEDSAATPVPTATPSHTSQNSTDTAAAMRALESLAGQHAKTQAQPTNNLAAATNQPALAPEARFAEDNHPNIVAGVRGQLLPSGGTMEIRLDPPELGPLAVTIRLNDGVMEASFETSNDQAAKLLSHSLSTLKQSLESQGVTVDRLHVQQAPKSETANQQSGNDRENPQNQSRDAQQEHAARQENQRKEMLRRMWQKLTGVEDPLDMVA